MAGNKNKPKKPSAPFEDGGVQFSRCPHTVPLEDHICQMRSVLDKNEEELKTARKEVSDVRGHYEDQLNRMSTSLHLKDQDIRSWMERAQQNEQQYNDSVARMQNFYTQEMNNLNAALREKCKEVEFLKHSASEKETYIQRKMEESRYSLQQKNEELKSFKDRVAGEVALSIKTGKAESMNNPVSKTRLREMYEELRTLWPAIKKHLNSSGKKPEAVRAKLQEVFSTAMESGEQQRSQIDQLYGLDEAGGKRGCQKVHEYRKATIQYLQLTLYHNGKDEAQSKASLLHEGGAQEAMDFLFPHCQWLGNLMALNDPPLVPDWENHDPGMNKWDILPRNLRSSTVL